MITVMFLKKDFILHSHDWKCLNFWPTSASQITMRRLDRYKSTRTLLPRRFEYATSSSVGFLTVLMIKKLYIRHVWVIKFLSICIDLILSLPSETHSSVRNSNIFDYCNRRNYGTRFNFVYFVLLAESTKFSCIRKPCTLTSVCDTILAVRKLIAHESLRTLDYGILTHTKISMVTVASACFELHAGA